MLSEKYTSRPSEKQKLLQEYEESRNPNEVQDELNYTKGLEHIGIGDEENYIQVINDFVNKNPSWEKMNGISYIEAGVFTDGKIVNVTPYNTPAIIKKENGKIIDAGWPQHDGSVISIKELLSKNSFISNETFNYIINTMYSEVSLANKRTSVIRDTIGWMDHLDDKSNSALKTKITTFDDYSESEKEYLMDKVANLQMIRASREGEKPAMKTFLGKPNTPYFEETGMTYRPIYDIYGYKNAEDFKKDLKNGKITNTSELGVAMGIVIHDFIMKQITIQNLDNFTDSLSNNQNKNNYTISESRVDSIVKYIESGDNIDRLGAIYPTNIPKTKNNSIQQVTINLKKVLDGTASSKIAVDGDPGQGTEKAAKETNVNLYKPDASEITKNKIKIEHKEIMNAWRNKFLSLKSPIENSIDNKTQLSQEHKDLISDSIFASGEATYVAVDTLLSFLKSQKNNTEYKAVNNLFDTYINSRGDENINKILTLLENPNYFVKTLGINPETVKHFYQELITNTSIATAYIYETEMAMPLLYHKPSDNPLDDITGYLDNQTNSWKRATAPKDLNGSNQKHISINLQASNEIQENNNVSIAELQKSIGLTGNDIDGIKGNITKTAINRYNELKKNLNKNSKKLNISEIINLKGEELRAIQRKVMTPDDGIYGKDTQRAIIQYNYVIDTLQS